MDEKSEEYRQHAFYCRSMADSAVMPQMKANWLSLAEKWLAMVPNDATGREDFNTPEQLLHARRQGEASH
jgi:hypothetical protein